MNLERRNTLARDLLNAPYDELSPTKRSVIDLMVDELPSMGPPALSDDDRTFWQRLADRVAVVGGSWRFIGTFSFLLLVWVGSNAALARWHAAFDPYPFIFLNLILSMVAALQAPVIMMSQNRQSAKDRQAAEHDYVVNLRAELEIMRLHDKLDALRQGELLEMVKGNAETLAQLHSQLTALTANHSS